MTDFKQFNDLMYQKENKVKLVRMAVGYVWGWNSKNDKDTFDIEIQGIKKLWNHCTKGWGNLDEAIHEVGCIHSIQGYDLNSAFVIVGNEVGYNAEKNTLVVRTENYYD